jgi:hypothetical protein
MVGILDMEDVMLIDIYAMYHATDRIRCHIPPEEPIVLGEHMTDDDYRHGIRRYFRESEGWEECLVTPLLKELKEEHVIQNQLRCMADTLVSRIFSGRMFG